MEILFRKNQFDIAVRSVDVIWCQVSENVLVANITVICNKDFFPTNKTHKKILYYIFDIHGVVNLLASYIYSYCESKLPL